jgi:hypothetical protein
MGLSEVQVLDDLLPVRNRELRFDLTARMFRFGRVVPAPQE